MTDLWQRLRQRKLVQWALAFVAASFALIQVLDVVAQQSVGLHAVPEGHGRAARCQPEFPVFVRKVGFAALWDKYGPPDLCVKDLAGDYACQ